MRAIRRLLTLCTVLALIAAFTVTVSASTTTALQRSYAPAAHPLQAAAGKPTREIFGYATAGSLGDPSWGYTSWDWSLLGTVAYFALHVADTGAIVSDSNWTTWNSS